METATKKMTKTEFNKNVLGILRSNAKGIFPSVRTSADVFRYARWCERNFEINLNDNTGKERKYTFFSDISIGECYGIGGVVDTIKRCFKEWIFSKEAIAELLISINYKAWEMQARHHPAWTEFYSNVYNALYSLVMDYYKEHNQEAADYVANYLD